MAMATTKAVLPSYMPTPEFELMMERSTFTWVSCRQSPPRHRRVYSGGTGTSPAWERNGHGSLRHHRSSDRVVLLDHGHADDLLGAVDRDERDAMRCPNCQDTHVTGLGVTPGTRGWECLNCGYIWPRDAARLERIEVTL